MSVHAYFHSLPTAAFVPEVQHRLLQVGVDRRRSANRFVSDEFLAVHVDVTPEAMVPVAKIVYSRHPRNEEFRHFGRHNELPHVVVSSGRGGFSLFPPDERLVGPADLQSRGFVRNLQFVNGQGYRSVNPALAGGQP